MNTQERDVLLAALDWFHCPTPHSERDEEELEDAIAKWIGGRPNQWAPIDAMRAKLTENPNDQME